MDPGFAQHRLRRGPMWLLGVVVAGLFVFGGGIGTGAMIAQDQWRLSLVPFGVCAFGMTILVFALRSRVLYGPQGVVVRSLWSIRLRWSDIRKIHDVALPKGPGILVLVTAERQRAAVVSRMWFSMRSLREFEAALRSNVPGADF